MNEMRRWAEGVSYGPCPPEEFCGRGEERKRLLDLLFGAGEHGQAVMISGLPGIGKTSLLNWLAYSLQDRPDGPGCLVIRAETFEPPRMVFSAFRKLLYDLHMHTMSGWFRDPHESTRLREAMRYANDLLEKYAAPVEPIGLLPKTGEEIIGVFTQVPEVEYDQVRKAHLELLQELGEVMRGADRIAIVLLDDLHLASRPDRRLLRDIIRDLPPGILLVFTCEDEEKYEAVLERDTHRMHISGMQDHEIGEVAQKRFNLSLDDAVTAFLAEAASDPFSLVALLNTLRRHDIEPSIESIQNQFAKVRDPAEMAFNTLPEFWQTWAEELSVLIPPFPVPVMACMLDRDVEDMMLMLKHLQGNDVFRRLPGGGFAFTHSLLQEHCRKSLSAGERVALNVKAADCFEQTMLYLPMRLHALLSLVNHFFNAQDYAKVAELNLELGLRFYNREDYDTALMLTDQSIVSAEHLGDGALLTVAESQRDQIRRKIAEFGEAAL